MKAPAMISVSLFLAVAMTLAFCQASGQARAEGRLAGGVILGTATDSSLRPVGDVDVTIVRPAAHLLSDTDGRFIFTNVPTGEILIALRKIGYRPILAGVMVPAGDTLRLAFIMETSPVTLAAVVVTERAISSRLRDFEERRRNGAGQFFNQSEIEARNVFSTSDLLRQVKGVSIVTVREKLLASSGRQLNPCPMQIYVDGIGMSSHSGPFDLNDLPSPKETMAIEVYSGPASVPLWLPLGPTNGKQQCGVVLIWTRDGSRM
jgi:Carboxypeptidase regulatory-like domain/TonB-dependent Receptor Plug Domain